MNKITDKTTINTENNTISLSHNKSQQPQIFHFLPLKPCFVRSFFVPCSFFLRFWVPLFEGVTKLKRLRSDSGRSESHFFSLFTHTAALAYAPVCVGQRRRLREAMQAGVFF